MTVELADKFRQHTDLPLSVFPNAGQPEIKEGEVYYPQSPEDYATRVKDFVDRGVKIFGGCCGSTPETIAAIAKKKGDLNV